MATTLPDIMPTFKIRKKRKGNKGKRDFPLGRLVILFMKERPPIAHVAMPSGKKSWEIKWLPCLECNL